MSKKCSHLWKINNYSTVMETVADTLRSVKFSAPDDDLEWCLEHMVTVCGISGRTFVSFNIRPDSYEDLAPYESVSGNVEVCVKDGDHDDASLYTIEKSFVFKFTDYDELDSCGTLPGIDMNDIEQIMCDDELLISCRLTYLKKNKIVAISSSNNSNAVKISESRFLNDMEKCFNEDRFKDVTISVKGKEYRAHKNILATRSTVFDKMLSSDMLESKENHIDITDVDQETFEEMLYYIYTGKVRNLDESAFELLPVADRYDLGELRIMCEEGLLKKLSPENAVKILILADMHRAEELKAGCLRFIKKNYANCKDFIYKEVAWKSLTIDHDHLLKDLLDVFST